MNKDEIIKWAEETVAMKGTKFTPLSKDSQYAIAKLIVEQRDAIGRVTAAEGDPGIPPQECELMDGVAAEGDEADDSIPMDDHEGIPAEMPSDAIRPTMMRRADFFRLRKMDAQAAYDAFLKWASENPRDAVVMDFATGEKNHGASFAYWISETVNVDEMMGVGK